MKGVTSQPDIWKSVKNDYISNKSRFVVKIMLLALTGKKPTVFIGNTAVLDDIFFIVNQ